MTSKSPPDPELTERLRSLVGRLVVDLRIGEGRGAEGLATASVAMLGKMISPYDVTKVATTQTQRTLTERAPDPAAFRRAYEDLKATGAREVDKYLAVVAKIASDPDVLAAVTRAPGESAAEMMGGDSFPATFGTSSGGDATMDNDDDGYGVPSPNLEMSARAESAGRSVETTRLGPLGNFSFNTNPLASETDADAAPSTPGASVGMRTMTQRRSAADDDRPEGGGPVDPDGDVGSARMQSLRLTTAPTTPAPAPPRTPTIAEDIRARIAGERPRLREGVDFPALPAWMSDRPYLTGAHLGRDATSETKSTANADPIAGKPLDAYTTACQELLVLDDLLYAMLGAEGRYVRARRVDAATGEPIGARDSSIVPSSVAEYIGSGGGSGRSHRREPPPPPLAGTAVRFAVEPGLEASLAALVENMLPLCSHAAQVADYVETRVNRFEGGLVAHALAAEMQELLSDWRTTVVQLEHQRNLGRLSLQSAWFYVQPAVGAMSLLARISRRASSLRGASLLNEISREAATRAGDVAARNLCLRLLRAASAPYAKAVERWVYEGVVDDPYDEFLVIERAHLRKESLAEDYNATYWSQRYTLRSEVPAFLGEGLAEKALTTGKYINAMRESRKTTTTTTTTDSGRFSRRREGGTDGAATTTSSSPEFSLPPIPPDGLGRLALGGGASSAGSGTHAARINAAHRHASVALLRAVLGDGDLHGRLRAMKRYFLLDKGDFLVHFTDNAGEELARRAPDISVSRLQSLLELSLKLSTASTDPHNDDLTCSLERQGIIHQLLSIHVTGGAKGYAPADADLDLDENAAQMTPKEALRLTGFETFALDYNAPWPVSLVLSRRAITKYQLLFRHVFHCKHVERRLCEAWQTHQATRAAAAQTTGAGDGGSLGRAYVLSQRMLHFLQNFTYYLMCEVVEPNWHAFETALRDAQSVDELIDAHERFLDACMKEGMLFWPRILRRLERIKNVCLKFCGLSETLEQSLPGRGSFRENLRAGRLSVAGGEDTGGRVSASARERVEARYEAAQAIFDACEGDKYASEVARLEGDFDAQLRELLEALNGSAHLEPNLASLCARLDFNEFYSFGPGGKYT